jgi:eukaryotic-like serine/threonine-protein kinase
MKGPELHERASALFLECRDLPPEERAERVAALGPEDPLRAEVLSLLEHDGAGAERPGGGDPAFIGPYRVLRRLGRGGSGFVLLAEQRQPVRRRVAIKLVPHAAVSPDFAARFEFERRALERIDHPHIARILDAGRTPDGMPYLVMEYIDGVPINQHCREARLDTRGRIGLVLDVADAVQHAHQRGVIHRDLSPANILVSGAGGNAMARVLDFGIAKPIAGAFAGETLPPQTVGHALGTPAYMAPEQTGAGAIVDTRADVYALGAVLYELSCGRPPVDVRGDMLEVLRSIREGSPPPIKRVREENAADFAGDAASRPLLEDLDCVLAMALQKDPQHRYQTVAAMVQDLQRLLRSEAIDARPPTLRYRAARFTQRHRALVASGAAVALAVSVGIAGLTLGLLEARRQKREAANQGESQREINRFLTEDLLAPASPDLDGQHITALELLRRASGRVDQRFPNRPLVAASVHHTLGQAFTALGEFDDAESHLKRAVEIRRGVAGVDAPDTLRSEIAAASLLGQREKYEEAAAALLEVVRRGRLVLGSDDPALYAAINDLGVMYEGLDRGTEAVGLLQEALLGRTRLLGPEHPQVLATMSNLAQAYERTGDVQRSLELLMEALRIADASAEPAPMTVLELNNNIGATLLDLQRQQEAAPYLRRAAEVAAARLGPKHPGTLSIQGNLAGLEAKLGDPERAAELYDAVYRARVELLGPDAYDTLVARYGYANSLFLAKRFPDAASVQEPLLADMARAMGDDHWLTVQTRAALARTLVDGGHAQQALPHARRATEQFTALYGPDHMRTKNARATLEQISAQGSAPP